jgi:ABC-type glycerol-3-phosphate transport system substrate-binding protein
VRYTNRMFGKMSTFQIAALGICVMLVMLGVGVFASVGGLGGNTGVGTVVIWGTADQTTLTNTLATLTSQDKSFQNVSYVQKDSATYYTDLINAMAAGTGPDLFLLPQDQLQSFADKVAVIPYSAVSQASFVNSYIDEGQLFLTPQGEVALPLIEDPLVMYWNRDLFATAGIASPPTYWNDLLAIAPKITSIDTSQTVQKSSVALGLWQNITNAKEILSALFMQAGDPIVARDANGTPQAVFGATPQGAAENPASSALQFYTEFANPSKTTYSWNAALPQSQDAFVAGDVAVYFGFASEDAAIAARNPNLNFAVALLPQLQGSSSHATFGRLTGIAISRTAVNRTGALTIAEKLSGQTAVSLLASATGLPPVRRDVAVDTSGSAAASVFEQSALIARGWLDPDPSATDALFKAMIESVASGASDSATAVGQAASALAAMFKQ